MSEFIAIGIIVIVAFYVILVENAPYGYEDEKGFHYGKKDE